MGFGQTDGDINQHFNLLDTDLSQIVASTPVDESESSLKLFALRSTKANFIKLTKYKFSNSFGHFP